MLIYIALAALPAILSLFLQDIRNNRGQRYLLYFICGSALFLFMGLRTADLGSIDSINYFNNYRYAMAASSWDTFYRPDHFEMGFQFIVYGMAQVLPHPQWLFVFASALYVISLIYFIEHNSDEPTLSLVAYITLGMMLFQMQGMRQAIAISFCMLAFEQAKRKHLIRFLLLVGIATLFHQTALIFFPIYIVCRLKVTPRNIVIVVLLATVAVLLSETIIGIANDIFDRDYQSSVDQGGVIATLLYFIIMFVCYLAYRNNTEIQRSSLVYILILGTACYIMRYVGAQAAERISFYFMFSQIALLPNALKIMVREHRRYMYLAIVALSIGLLAYRLSDSYFIPYRLFWNDPYYH